MTTADNDPDAAPPADAGLFGLPTTPDEARLVIAPHTRDALGANSVSVER